MKKVQHIQAVPGLDNGGPDASNGTPVGADWRQSQAGLEQRVAELEQQVAELSARNAELIHARQESAEASRQLQALLDNIPDLIYFKDSQCRIFNLNQALVRFLGATAPEQVIGKTDFDFQIAERAQEFFEDEQRILKTGEPLINKTEQQVLPNGEIAWTSTTKVPLRDDGGKIIGLVGISREITAQKKAEEALRQSHGKLEQQIAERTTELSKEQLLLRTLIDSFPDLVFVKDAGSRFILVNAACARQLGAGRPEEVLGKTDADFVTPELAAQYRANEEALMRSGQPMNQEERTQHKTTGAMRWSLTTKIPLKDKAGKVVGLLGIARDITEFKQAEEALARERLLLRTLIDNLPDGVYAKDTAGRKTLANPADLKVLGCKTEAEAIGKSDFDLFPKDIAEKFWADDQKVIHGEPVINREEFFIDEKGRKRWLLTSKLPLRNEGGKIVGLVGIGRDITLQKQAEDALRRSDEKLRKSAVQLERSNRELQDFAYVASHDLQEPLRKVTVFSERLKDKNADKFDPESLDYLDRMQKATGRMQTLINDLLSFSRVTTKAQPFTPVSLAEVAAGVVEDLEGRIEMVKGRVELGTLPVIEAEPLQMRQLLQNLIGNALKFRRPEEPPVVKVEAQLIPDPAAPDKQLCRLTVSDNCIGFDEKYLDRIFNVFQRLHTRNEYEGTGMGLAIVRKIALYHGGDITAKSKPGEGSTFILTVPATHPQIAQAETKKQEDQKPPAALS